MSSYRVALLLAILYCFAAVLSQRALRKDSDVAPKRSEYPPLAVGGHGEDVVDTRSDDNVAIMNRKLQGGAIPGAVPPEPRIARGNHDGNLQHRSPNAALFPNAHQVEGEPPHQTQGRLRRRGSERTSTPQGDKTLHVPQTPDEVAKQKKADKKARQKARKTAEKEKEEAKKAEQEAEERLKRERKARKQRPLTAVETESERTRNAYRHLEHYAKDRPLEPGKTYAVKYFPPDRKQDPALLTGAVGSTLHEGREHPTYDADFATLQQSGRVQKGRLLSTYKSEPFRPPRQFSGRSHFLGEVKASGEEILQAGHDISQNYKNIFKKHFPDVLFGKISGLAGHQQQPPQHHSLPSSGSSFSSAGGGRASPTTELEEQLAAMGLRREDVVPGLKPRGP